MRADSASLFILAGLSPRALAIMPHLHDLPDWDDLRRRSFSEEDEESWKKDPTTETCKAMYRQWQQVAYLLSGVLPDENAFGKDKVSAEMRGHIATQIWGDVMQAAVKMRSSVHLQYVSRMESAAIIRKCAQDVALALWSLQEFGVDDDDNQEGLEEHHRQVLRAEIDAFRMLFRDWVATFRKEPDEMEDEWGLFV